MAEIGKFIFTNEGRRMLVAQNGGIHFAVMGAILLTRGFNIDDDEEIKKVTWEKLKSGEYGTLGLKGIAYTSNGEGSEILTTDPNYASALENILNRESTTSATFLFDTTYQPDLGLKDQESNVYGLYSFKFDKTKFNCTGTPNFKSIVLIGKQYITDGDAKYNIDNAQLPTVVGILTVGSDSSVTLVKFENNGDEDRNKFTEYKFEWRITITENPITEGGVELADSLSGINNGFQLINDGIKTNNNVKLTVDDKEIYQFNLNKEGNIATSRSVLMTDVIKTDTIDEQFNQPGILHLINKHVQTNSIIDANDPNAYRPQQIISTFKCINDSDYESDPITAVHVKTTLTADNDQKTVLQGMSRQTPVYSLPSVLGDFYSEATYNVDAVSENIAVNLFGMNNSAYDKSHAMFIQSNDNWDISTNEPWSGGNLYLASNKNTYLYNYAKEVSGRSVFINSNQNYIASENNALINSDQNYITSENNALINSDCSYLKNGNNLLLNSYDIKINANASDNATLNSLNVEFAGVGTYSGHGNVAIKGVGDRFEVAYNSLMLNTHDCRILSAKDSTIINCYDSDVKRDIFKNRNTSEKLLLNGVGLKGMNQYRQIVMGEYNATYKNYSYLSYYDPETEKWSLGNYDDGVSPDESDSVKPISSVFVIGAGIDDKYRRNALEFSLMDKITAYGTFYGGGTNDGYLGKLTTDWIYAPYIESRYIKSWDIACSTLNVEEEIKTLDITASYASINAQRSENLTATNITATSIMIGNKTLEQYIRDIINNS